MRRGHNGELSYSLRTFAYSFLSLEQRFGLLHLGWAFNTDCMRILVLLFRDAHNAGSALSYPRGHQLCRSRLFRVYWAAAIHAMEKVHASNITGLLPGRKRLVAAVADETKKKPGASRGRDTPGSTGLLLCGKHLGCYSLSSSA